MNPEQLAEWMAEQGIPSARALAKAFGCDRARVTDMLKGNAPIPEYMRLATVGYERERAREVEAANRP